MLSFQSCYVYRLWNYLLTYIVQTTPELLIWFTDDTNKKWIPLCYLIGFFNEINIYLIDSLWFVNENLDTINFDVLGSPNTVQVLCLGPY